MFDRCHLNSDHEFLKDLIFRLSIAVGSFENHADDGGTMHKDFRQITLYFNSREGNISIGIDAPVAGRKFFPNVFQGLHDVFTSEAYFFMCFDGAFGSGISSTFLGAVPCLPELSHLSTSGHFQMTLLGIARYSLIPKRRESLLRKITCHVLDMNVATFSYILLFPLLLKDDPRLPSINVLNEHYNKFTGRRYDNHVRQASFTFLRKAFLPLLKQKMPLNTQQSALARYLSYNTVDYYDAFFQARGGARRNSV